MEKTDYIIVGDGYAALFFAHQLTKNNKSFLLFSEGKKSASQISAGIVNPVVLKKFTTFWKAQEQIDNLKETLKEIESYTGKNFLIEQPIHRIFHDENEKNLWQKKVQTDELESFLNPEFFKIKTLKNPFETGQVLQSARLDMSGFFEEMFRFLNEREHLIKEKFDYRLLNASDNIYDNKISFNKIIFAEGMGVKDNPFFAEIPVNPNKGHNLKVKLQDDYHQEITVKKKHFLFPLIDENFYYGGTYDREQTHHEIDDAAIQQLENGLAEIYPVTFEIQEKNFGFRPTVKDRRPILGQNEEFKNLYVFNGLGARGVLNGSYFSKILYDFTENGIALPEEVDLKRFNP